MLIHLELDHDQNFALARALNFRYKYLETLPPSPERDQEMCVLVSIIRQALPQSKQRASHMKRMAKEFEE